MVDSRYGEEVVQDLQAARVEHPDRLAFDVGNDMTKALWRLRRARPSSGSSRTRSLIQGVGEVVEVRWDVVVEVLGHVVEGSSVAKGGRIDTR